MSCEQKPRAARLRASERHSPSKLYHLYWDSKPNPLAGKPLGDAKLNALLCFGPRRKA